MLNVDDKVAQRLKPFLTDLQQTKSVEGRTKIARNLRFYIESVAHSKSSDNYTAIMDYVNHHVMDWVNGTDMSGKMTAVIVINELLDVVSDENETRVQRFSYYQRMIMFSEVSSLSLLQMTAHTFGHQVRTGGTLTTDLVVGETRRALEALRSDKEDKWLGGLLLLKVLAENTPTLFATYQDSCIDCLPLCLRSAKETNRDAALATLEQCLILIERRQQYSQKEQQHTRIYQVINDLFALNTLEGVYVGLRCVQLLLDHAAEYVSLHFQAFSTAIIRQKDHREKSIREMVISILPKLVSFPIVPAETTTVVLNHLTVTISKCTVDSTLGTAYTALGELILNNSSDIQPKLDVLTALIKDGLRDQQRKLTYHKALRCLGNLAQALGSYLLPHAYDLINLIFSNGLSSTLVSVLTDITMHIPSLLPSVQTRQLASIALILNNGGGDENDVFTTSATPAITGSTSPITSTSFNLPSVGASILVSLGLTEAVAPPVSQQDDLISLALATLGKFNFHGHNLLQFTYEYILPYMSHANSAVRREAYSASLKIVLRSPVDPLLLYNQSHQSLHKKFALLHTQIQLQQQVLLSATTNTPRATMVGNRPTIVGVTPHVTARSVPLQSVFTRPESLSVSLHDGGEDASQPISLASIRASVANQTEAGYTSRRASTSPMNAPPPAPPIRRRPSIAVIEEEPLPAPRGSISLMNILSQVHEAGPLVSPPTPSNTPVLQTLALQLLRGNVNYRKQSSTNVMNNQEKVELLKKVLEAQLFSISQLHAQLQLQLHLEDTVFVTPDSAIIQDYLQQISLDSSNQAKQQQGLLLQVQQQQQLLSQAEAVGQTPSLQDSLFTHLTTEPLLVALYNNTSHVITNASAKLGVRLNYINGIAVPSTEQYSKLTDGYVETDGKEDSEETTETLAQTKKWTSMRESILLQLTSMCFIEKDPALRGIILSNITKKFDNYMQSPKYLQFLLLCLQDSHLDNRKAAMTVICRLCETAPGVVMPLLRQFIVELLTKITHMTEAKACTEHCIMLTHMASSAPMVLRVYAEPVLKVLVGLLPKTSNETSLGVLSAISEMCVLGGVNTLPHVFHLTAVITAAIIHHAYPALSNTNTAGALFGEQLWLSVVTCSTNGLVTALHKICISSGWVIVPYIVYPNLLSALMYHILNGSQQNKAAAAALVGALGAIDSASSRLLTSNTKNNIERVRKNILINESPDVMVIAPDSALVEDEVSKEVQANVTGSSAEKGLNFAGIYSGSMEGAKREIALTNAISGNVGIPIVQLLAQSSSSVQLKLPVKVLEFFKEQSSRFGDLSNGTARSATDNSSSVVALPGLGVTGDSYYCQVAVQTLTCILMDSQATHNHKRVVDALMFICKGQGTNCTNVLSHIVPAFLHASRHYDDQLQVVLLEQLSILIILAGDAYTIYADATFHFIIDCWKMVEKKPIEFLRFLQTLSMALKPQFENFLPQFLPKLLTLLLEDVSIDRTLSHHIIATLSVFGSALTSQVHTILPALVQFWRVENLNIPVACRAYALHITAEIAKLQPRSNHIDQLVLPLLNIIKYADNLVATQQAKNPKVLLDKPSSSLGDQALSTLGTLVVLLNTKFTHYLLMTINSLNDKPSPLAQKVLGLLHKLLDQQPLTMMDFSEPLPCWKNYVAVPNQAEFEAIRAGSATQKLAVSQEVLVKLWDTSQRVTSEDWLEWLKNISVQLLKESPSPPLRACSPVAQKDNVLARKLLPVAFASCWFELRDCYQDAITSALDTALKSNTVPVEVITGLLNIIECMERSDSPQPLDIRLLASLAATKCHAYAKALHYKEMEFYTTPDPGAVLEDLIAMHSKLQQPQAAIGILRIAPLYAAKVQDRWSEQLHRWNDALAAYEWTQLTEAYENNMAANIMEQLTTSNTMTLPAVNRDRFARGSMSGSIIGSVYMRPIASLTAQNSTCVFKVNGVNIDVILARLRCFRAMSDYQRVATQSIQLWNQLQTLALDAQTQDSLPGNANGSLSKSNLLLQPEVNTSIIPSQLTEASFFAVNSLHMLGKWEDLPLLMPSLPPDSFEKSFYQAVYAVHKDELDKARELRQTSCDIVQAELGTTLLEGYSRAYPSIIGTQMLQQLDDVITYKKLITKFDHEQSQSWEDSVQNAHQRAVLRESWWLKLQALEPNAGIWHHMLALQSLVLTPLQNARSWLAYASMLQKQNLLDGSLRVIETLFHRKVHEAPPDYYNDCQVVQHAIRSVSTDIDAEFIPVRKHETVNFLPNANIIIAAAKYRNMKQATPQSIIQPHSVGTAAVQHICNTFASSDSAMYEQYSDINSGTYSLGVDGIGFRISMQEYPDMAVGIVAVAPTSLALHALVKTSNTYKQSLNASSLLSDDFSDQNSVSPLSYHMYACFEDDPRVAAGYVQHLWNAGFREEALDRIHHLICGLECLLSNEHMHHDHYHAKENAIVHPNNDPTRQYVYHPLTQTLYIKHHKQCPHYKPAANTQKVYEENDEQNDDLVTNNKLEPLICMLTACPPPYITDITATGGYNHPDWSPLAALRTIADVRLRSQIGKLCQMYADWSAALLSEHTNTLNLEITQTQVDADSNSVPQVTISRSPAISTALESAFAAYRRATVHTPKRYRVWHGMAGLHYRVAQLLGQAKQILKTNLDLHAEYIAHAASDVPPPTEQSAFKHARRASQIALAAAMDQQISPQQNNPQTTSYHIQQYKSLSAEFYMLRCQLHYHVTCALRSFSKAIPQAFESSDTLQDILRLLSLWFEYGTLRHVAPPPGLAHLAITKNTFAGIGVFAGGNNANILLPSVRETLSHCFQSLNINTWVRVTPQIIARLHSEAAAGPIRSLIHDLLVLVGNVHPQALVYPLTVAAKSTHQKPTSIIDSHLQAALGLTSDFSINDDEHIALDQITNKFTKRGNTAMSVMRSLCTHSPELVEQSIMISTELIRIAVLWEEEWQDALEEASRLWFGNHDGIGMLSVLLPLHRKLEISHLKNSGQTSHEIMFLHMFARELNEAQLWCLKYLKARANQLLLSPNIKTYDNDASYKNKAMHNPNKGVHFNSTENTHGFLHNASTEFLTGDASDLNQAWDIYCTVFKSLNKFVTPDSKTQYIYLYRVSPKLLAAKNLTLAVPGTYDPDQNMQECVHIAGVDPKLQIIQSKQRPRKLALLGSDGEWHNFLLKGHEDLRQDGRVMQLFDLVNALLAGGSTVSNTNTSIEGSSMSAGGSANGNNTEGTPTPSNSSIISIRGYSVIPLSPITGLLQWLGNCDTMHELIKEYRQARYVLLDVEHRLMLTAAPNFALGTITQKMHAFTVAMKATSGRDLADVLWLKAATSESWLERRSTYVRSLATMSMVGYILGLGDRHPCNLMLERSTGQIVHIDFGDCFEVAMHREKMPEKIPFRLTRMLVRAMEVSGIEGTYRQTCERVMSTLRDNKESVMAVLEAFIYDPLITWRLLTKNERDTDEIEDVTKNNDEENDNHAEDDVLESTNLLMNGSLSFDGGGMGSDLFSQPPNKTQGNSCMQEELDLYRVVDFNEPSSALLNAKALAVIKRVEAKLLGKDFDLTYSANLPPSHSSELKPLNKVRGFIAQGESSEPDKLLNVENQVERLINEATSVTNLAQCYIGWCGFW